MDSPDTEVYGLIDTSKSVLRDVLAGIAINEPVYFFGGPSPFPPVKAYWHLNVPLDVSKGMNADQAHAAGFTGKGVKLVMVDTGWYQHPFFVEKGYSVNPVVLGPAATDPEHDEIGHGTGESANAFSVAPEAEFTMVKMSFVNSVGAFNTAVSLKPDVISCSWGSSKRYPQPDFSAADQALAAAIANAVDQGITVVFSAGNGQWGFPGQHPDVISAGGVYMNPDGSLEATPYASGFKSNIYSERNVPDVCGLVGLPPRAQYIMLPVEPNDYLDKTMAGKQHPDGDETEESDGWAAFSGTSAAAPQLAGICALIKQARGDLTPEEIRSILKETARDVTKGSCSPITGGHYAGPGSDLATGCGLADAFQAVLLAQNQNVRVKQMNEENNPLVSAIVFLKSQSGSTLANQSEPVTTQNIEKYRPYEDTVAAATKGLQDLGFNVSEANQTNTRFITLTITGSVDLFEKVFKVRLSLEKRAPTLSSAGGIVVRPDQKLSIPPSLTSVVDDVRFEEPVELF